MLAMPPKLAHKLALNLPNLLRTHNSPYKGECVRVQCVRSEVVHVR